MNKFEKLGLSEELLKSINELGFEKPTPIQENIIPVILEGYDVIGQAQTGTGKTLAFSSILLTNLKERKKKPQAYILSPTRELTMQIHEELKKLGKYSSLRFACVYGGSGIEKQIKSIKKGVDIVVGTPGRMMDLMRRKVLQLDEVSYVVLDEADEMLNMGFRDDIETILSGVPEERQTVLFSATMPKPILEITKKYQNHAELKKVTKKELTVPNIEQFYYEVKPKNKEEVLSRLLDIYSPNLSVVFCNTKKQVDNLVTALIGRGYFAAGLHGDLKQSQRDRVMQSFRTGKTEILVATDVAARGIDVDDVEAVFNYDLPQDEEYYVHRIGRTGRAGNEGTALTFCSQEERKLVNDIQKLTGKKLNKADFAI